MLCSKESKICIRKLSIVDNTLEMLGTPKKYRQLYSWLIGIITGWISLALLVDISDIVWLNYEYFSITRILVPFIGNYLDHVVNFNVLICGIMVGYTGSRFQRINEYIRDLCQQNTEQDKKRNELILVNQRRLETKKCKQYMWIIMHLHLQLCSISRELNKVFSVQMTLQTAYYFVTCVDMSRQIYRIYIDGNIASEIGQAIDNSSLFIFGFINNVKFIALNYICQSLCDKANETIAILYKLSNYNSDKDLNEQILQFILQIKQRELKLSGMGLFYFGYNLIRKFYMSVATVLVIIIQMSLPNSNHYIPPTNSTN
ncbi:uncharacterized protein LOC114932035 [Nylanderia fulva]|uniref:uncharacterized protein LOC114932035 n=1 Tax=Nylanderia fulva TaxID=613905 RepID=UPI0010FB0CCC|nr:uncharacterized protein LOC114932035 [Nylanderia fulva]